ncbi:MAG: dihydropteroate synthase [Candidatus Sungbacteria bacterium]|uniref:dihydropteroate synthase n=1 Tax=Candidatus Sungiibacteriota bacterium TaxID=2750080 RepID=A0A932VRL7_9BACT|nr:dihydropteroate synthase [Candidatus Sungbacteria bacterium]
MTFWHHIGLPRGRMLAVGRRTLVVGTLNVTPDSFYDGGRFFPDAQKAIARLGEILYQGANIVDIGGESTRPGSVPISAEEELARVIPVINAARKRFGPAPVISIDTCKSEVASRALEAGGDMINCLGGTLFDQSVARVAAESGCPIVIYHIRGSPRTMQEGEIMYEDIIGDIKKFFEEQIAFLIKSGARKEQCIIDPGIGFGKTVAQNLEIIRRLGEFKTLGLPIMIDVSRKGHLGVILKDAFGMSEIPPPEERLEAGLAETAVAVMNGAGMVRTHDVFETRKFLAVIDAVRQA